MYFKYDGFAIHRQRTYTILCITTFGRSTLIQTILLYFRVFNSFLVFVLAERIPLKFNFNHFHSWLIQVDSAFKTFGLPSRASRRYFKKTDERVYREHANIREDSVTQREKLLHGYSSRGKSQRLAELFKLENNDHENVPNSFQPLQRKHHTSSSTRKSEYSTMTAVHTSRENVNKDYVFRDIVHNDGLNSYGR